ncbi:MAG TPA: amino acid adenylation domain-containing protein, partial [Thermoanaerobaculia bacterium]|nr:amino acid adenylation domain-containing protein [Thermoanaerobaculia bacterium]
VDLLAQLELLLAQAIERPEEPVASLSLLSDAARALLPDPAAVLDAGWIGSVHELFAAQARRLPERPAVIDGEDVWSYGDLLEGSLRVAGWLAAAGVQRGDRVAVFAHRSAPLAQAVLGVLHAGAAFVVLDPAYPAPRLIDMLRLAEPRAWVALAAAGAAPDEVRAWLDEAGCPRLELPAGGREAALAALEKYAGIDPQVAVGPGDPACITFTSGSTGVPKGIVGRHGPLSHFLPWIRERFGLSADDRFTLLSGLAHDPLQRDLFTPFYLGAALAVPDPLEVGMPGRIAAWMAREGVTVSHLTPAMAQLITQRPDGEALAEVPGLRLVMLVGEALIRLDVARLRQLAPRVTVVNLYGSTETQRAIGYHVATPQETAEAALGERGRQVLALGRGMQDVQLLVLNAAGGLAGLGEVGEIAVRSPHLAAGYLGEPALTAEKFQPSPWSTGPDDRLYRTGDLGRYLPGGEVAFAGRIDHQVKLRGFRIELGEIEALLALHPRVRTAAVVLRGGERDRSLAAFVVPIADSAVTAKDLHGHLWQRLPAYMVPSAFVFLDALPLTRTGKIDRKALAAFETQEAVPVDAARELRTPVEEIVAGIWAEILGRPAVGPDDNFFQLGGHSLTGAQMISRLRQTFDVELPLRVLFEAPTVAALAAEVGRRRRPAGGERPSITSFHKERNGTPPPLSFAQERFWTGRQLEARTVASTIPMVIRLDGALDLDCLRRALQEIVDRHEVLRTSFREEEGRPVQTVQPAARVEIPVVDMERVPPAGLMAEVLHWSTRDGRTHFDFERGPLFRLTLFRSSPAESVLLYVVHHIAFDGWSSSVLMGELAALYNAFRQGRPSPLRPLAAQYQDFSRWQRQVLQGETLEREVEFWRDHLRGATPVRLGKERPANPTFAAGIETFAVPQELEAKLDAFAAGQGVTLFMTLLAAFEALLHLESGRDDIVVTCLFANRNQMEIENLIGNFYAGLPLRTRLDGARTFRDLLERVRDVTLAAHEHPDILYEQAMEGLEFLEPGDRGGLATFRILFQLTKLPSARGDLSDLQVVRLPFDTGKIRQDLSLFLTQGGRLGGRFKYNRDVLDAERVVQLRDRFLRILETVVHDPDRPLDALLAENAVEAL